LLVLAARPLASSLQLASADIGKSQDLFDRGDVGPSLFCWSVIRQKSYEQAILEAQLSVGAGIFDCDGQAVFSEESFTLEGGFDTKGIGTLSANLGGAGPLGTGSWVNTDNFFRAWARLQEGWQFEGFDFVVKLDPDTVSFPRRIKQHLMHFGLSADDMVYLDNCPNVDNGFYGGIEVMSQAAFSSFMEGLDGCRQNLPYTGWGEDLFAQKCMEAVGVKMLGDYQLIRDGNCHGPGTPPPCTPGSAAYHPFKDTGAWLNCWKQASGRLDGQPGQVPIQLPGQFAARLPAQWHSPMLHVGSPQAFRGHSGAQGGHEFPTHLVEAAREETEMEEKGDGGAWFGGLPSYHRLK